MGLSEEDQKKSQELRLLVHGGTNLETRVKDATQINDASANMCGSQLDGTRCCQANEGSPCCQNPTFQEKREDEDSDFPKGAAKFTAETKNSRKQASLSNNGKGVGARKVCSMPTWYECWEREDTYAALAVIGAAISVAFAYNCYKQLG